MIRNKYRAIVADLDERGSRRWAAAEALALGYGGLTTVAKATGISDRTIRNGIQELNASKRPIEVATHDCPSKELGKAVEIVVNLISNTKTETGLEVHAWLDGHKYQSKKEVTDQELSEVNIKRNKFHGEWNYTILPNCKL